MKTTIQDVIDLIIATIPEAPLKDTVDTVKVGDPSQELKGIVSTFLVTTEVIEKAIEIGANLIVTHEPTFYEHEDKADWLRDDPVYRAKRRLLDEHHIVIWRFHDYWHRHRPDGVLTGVLKELGWGNQASAEMAGPSTAPALPSTSVAEQSKATRCFDIPPISLLDLAEWLKEKLHIQQLRIVGDPNMSCSRVALLVGKIGGQIQIETLRGDDIDVLLCGEINEWETCEYVRDSNHFGREKGLIILGHANSEEAGMKWFVEWLRPRLPGVKLSHIPAGDPFQFV